MIRMENVMKTFGSQTVLTDVTFKVGRQEIFGLLGPSGAGKTTIINILTRQFMAGSVEFEGIDANMFVTLMAPMFVGMALVQTVAGIIAEDRETKSLRFLVMAGVKPGAYLTGIGGVIFSASVLTSLAFALTGTFTTAAFLIFLSVLLVGAVGSILLGAIIGVMAPNAQAAGGLALPIAMILGFGPMAATFNESVGRVLRFAYTQQINLIVNDFSGNLVEVFIVMGVNIVVLIGLFILAYKKKGLKA